ncbi:hypothetical protein [Brucella cytisi]|nr:hypothetical protein [Brucella cytisi]
MKQVILGLLLAAAVSSSAMAGSCDHSWQTASDGSSCGGRAADQKPGGK